jgi:dynein heavy chain
VFWLGGFTFPSGFLTAIVQIEARKKGLPIDSFGWNFVIIDAPDIESLGAPDEGVYISGLFLEGARYDIASDCLSDPLPMELIHKMPVIHFHPSESAKKPNEHKYICPLYTCPDRAGPSQSPSYVFPLHLNIGSKSSDHWVKRGVAMLLSTAD